MKFFYWSFFIVVLLLSLVSRIAYRSVVPQQVYSDSISYWKTIQYYKTNSTLVDAWRTPVYPLFLVLSTVGLPDSGDVLTDQAINRIVFIQSLMGIGMICFLYIRLYALLPRALFVCCMVCLSLHPFLIVFEQIVLTETLALVLLVGILLLVIQILTKNHMLAVGLLCVLLPLSIFLRPAFLLIPFYIVVCLFYVRLNRQMIVVSVVLLISSFLPIMVYSSINYSMVGYRGITRISEINMLGKILVLELPLVSHDSSLWATQVRTYKQNGGEPNPWRLLDWNTNLYGQESLNELPPFVQTTLVRNIVPFVVNSMKEIPNGLWILTDEMPPTNDVRLTYWFSMFQFLHILRLVTCIGFVWFSYRVLKKKSRIIITGFVYCSFIVFHTCTSITLSYNDFGRHLVVLEPFVFIGCSLFLWDIWQQLHMRFIVRKDF